MTRTRRLSLRKATTALDFAELTHGAPPPSRARISSTELVETMAAGAETLAEVRNIVGECGDLAKKDIAESTHLKPMDVKAVFAAEDLNKKNISESTQIKPKDVFDAYDFCKNLAEPTQFKPSPQLAVMVAAREREKDLAKKISESTQIKPNDVRAVLTALHTIAYNDLKRQAKFVMPGVHLKARKTIREHCRWVITGNFKGVMKAMPVETCGLPLRAHPSISALARWVDWIVSVEYGLVSRQRQQLHHYCCY